MFKYNNPITIIKNYVLILLGILLISINNHSIMATKFNTKAKEIINHEINDQEVNKNFQLLNDIKQKILIMFIQISSIDLKNNKYALISNDNDVIPQIKDFLKQSKQKYPDLIEKDIKKVTKWVFLNGDTEDQNKIYNILQQILLNCAR
ncbi:SVM family protein [Candidatus Phytoplasma australasiaticum]|uniref:SVM family protein n=1 Tax=Candidatus Phytoplasma australasiaticum TaxID=2754999 RepID=UPI0027142A65|nr:hypothetical protein [Candidatus Phytoplasma australasiaticum]MDO8031285.1 hypothetical protein [Candidatus Phytoplasma australasiaticum]MDV3172027.1 hypothetical protein [Candidatus Phytoplasma australasiaticum]